MMFKMLNKKNISVTAQLVDVLKEHFSVIMEGNFTKAALICVVQIQLVRIFCFFFVLSTPL